MKKLFAIVLCLAMLVSAVAISTSAADKNSLIDVLSPYGMKPTYAPDSITTAPVVDGVVNTDEYTYVREFTNLSDPYVGKTFEDYTENYNFGGNCWPNNNVTVREYVAQDANYIYLAFEYDQDLKDFMLRFNPCQDTLYDMASSKHAQELAFDLPEGVNKDTKAASRWKEEFNTASKQDFSLLTDQDNIATPEVETDDYDGIAQRNFEADGTTFKNITAEFRFSKASMLASTKDTTDTQIQIFSYYCKGKRTEAGANIPEGSDVTLQWTVPSVAIMMDGYTSGSEYMAKFYPANTSLDHISQRAGQMFRFICFSEDPNPYVPEDESSTSETSATEATSATTKTTTAETTPEATTTVTEVTTEEVKGGCGNSIALSALAIVPVLSLGVAVVSKKKED